LIGAKNRKGGKRERFAFERRIDDVYKWKLEDIYENEELWERILVKLKVS